MILKVRFILPIKTGVLERNGAYAEIRTRDLFLTKEVLCLRADTASELNSIAALPSGFTS